MRLPKLKELVPDGKNILWVGGIVLLSFTGGAGWNAKTSEAQEHLAKIPAIDSTVTQNTARIENIEITLSDQEGDVAQILCYVKLIAEDESPGTELNPRCPNPGGIR